MSDNSSMKFTEKFSPRVLRNFKEPYDVKHDKFPEGNKYASTKYSEEIKRYKKLTTSKELEGGDAAKWFLFEEVYRNLQKVLNK